MILTSTAESARRPWFFFGPELPINIGVFEKFTKVPGRLARLRQSEPNPGGGVRGGVLYYSIVVQLYCVQYEASTRFGPLASADDGKRLQVHLQ